MPSDPTEIVSSLLKVPGLEGLEEVCKRHGVSLSCHGGTARRIAATASEKGTLTGWDIFDCVPFSSDIDLVHTGSSDQTDAILWDIRQTVPFAEQLRWEILSREEHARFEEAKLYSAIIPSLYIELTTVGWIDPWDGLNDISNRTFRFIRNGFYRRSPLYNAGVDVELMSALHYYKSLLSVPDASPDPGGLAAARQIVEEAILPNADTTIKLQESAYLRSRLRYALTSIKATAPERLRPSAPLFSDWGFHRIGRLLDRLGGATELREILDWDPHHGHLSVSSRIGGDIYRLPAVSVQRWESGSAALDGFTKTMKELSPTKEVGLESGQSIVLDSGPIKCKPGVAPSAQDNEFIHLCVRAEQMIAVVPQDLSAICVVSMSGHPNLALSVPTACSTPAQDDSGYLSLRCNLGRVLSTSANKPGRAIQVFVTQLVEQEDVDMLQWTSPGSSTGTPSTRRAP